MTRTRPSDLYTAVVSHLSPSEVLRCEEIFAGLEIEQDGLRYRIGHIIKAAWQAEDSLPAATALDIAVLLRAVLNGTASTYTRPACCRPHRLDIPAVFADPRIYPNDSELLASVTKLIWTMLPRWRAAVKMNCSPGKRQQLSRFMVLDSFVSWHDRDTIYSVRSLNDALLSYIADFKPSRNSATRRADVRRRIVEGEICGMIGAYNDYDSTFGVPHYCDQRRPFSTDSQRESKSRLDPPDRQLSRLGLQFRSGKRYVELVYSVEIGPRRTQAINAPALPSVVDSEGYWLFRPDRAPDRDGVRWNHTRNLETDKRGCRELITAPIAISQLVDLIVWPNPTKGSWAALAAPALAADNVV